MKIVQRLNSPILLESKTQSFMHNKDRLHGPLHAVSVCAFERDVHSNALNEES